MDSNYRQFTKPMEAHKAFNTLRGILNGMTFDDVIQAQEIIELEKWCDAHDFLSRKEPFNEIITTIQACISDYDLDVDIVKDLIWLCDKFEEGFHYYDLNTSNLQVMMGICHGILADGMIESSEVVALEQWLQNHPELLTYYPYDELYALVLDILKDGVVDKDEKDILISFLSEISKIYDSDTQRQIQSKTKLVQANGVFTNIHELTIADNTFCLSGNFELGPKSMLCADLKEKGGAIRKGVSKKLNYLVVGQKGNPCWTYACYGRKVEQAMKLKKEGSSIIIISEHQLKKFL